MMDRYPHCDCSIALSTTSRVAAQDSLVDSLVDKKKTTERYASIFLIFRALCCICPLLLECRDVYSTVPRASSFPRPGAPMGAYSSQWFGVDEIEVVLVLCILLMQYICSWCPSSARTGRWRCQISLNPSANWIEI